MRLEEKMATDPKQGLILGVDVGGTKTALVLGTVKAEVVRRMEFKTPVEKPFENAMAVIEAEMRAFLQECLSAGWAEPCAISVAVGGPLDIEQGILYAPPHLANWGEAHLKARLEQTFHLPVFVEHDGNAGALAEFYFGAGRGARNVIFLTMGTGLGAGLILNGAIFHGSSDAAGEVGHIRLAEEGPTEYGKVGSWEAFACGAGIVKLAHLRNPQAFPAGIKTAEVVKRALAGEEAAVNLIHEVGEWMGKGLAILVDLLNPDVIVIGTLGVVLGDLVLGPARAVVEREALPVTHRVCRIIPAELGSALMDVGCLMAAYDAYRSGKFVV
jgi:glucokinase